MRFLLVNPYYPISETPTPPLGLAFLAAALEEIGAEVKIADFVVTPYSKDNLKLVVKGFKPHIVGVTSVTMTFDNAIKVVEDIKSIDAGILTVMGGPHVSFCAEETLKRYPDLDIVAIGEGDRTIADLADAVENSLSLETINGIVYRNGSDIIRTKPRKTLADINLLPLPARHLLPLQRYRALGMAISMTTSRGCPFQCIFCVGRKMVGAKVRYREPHKVVDEIQYLATLGFKQINIADDLFTANKKHCIAICDEMIKRNIKIKWTSFARVDTVSEEVLSKMKAAGCTAVSFGIESANKEILKTIKKGITIQQVADAVHMCVKTGIDPHASFILGLPGETHETLKETLDFAQKMEEIGLSYGFHLLAPFPGTEVREEKEKYDLQILTDDWSQYHANRAIVATTSVSRETLDDIVIDWETKFKADLDKMGARMKKGEASEEETEMILNLERIIILYDIMMEELIEKRGSWSSNKKPLSPTDVIEILAGHIEKSTNHTKDKVFNSLHYIFEQGTIKYSNKDGQIRWAWAE
ncbi:MAG: radical SAM protein [Deltaproteobacteria bacterium]|nr:radical SAM protein [Deltaproteobacteria bacterium]